ncbi:hypothetical protein ABPG75_010007 [Micractinium tetrahymenae]
MHQKTALALALLALLLAAPLAAQARDRGGGEWVVNGPVERSATEVAKTGGRRGAAFDSVSEAADSPKGGEVKEEATGTTSKVTTQATGTVKEFGREGALEMVDAAPRLLCIGSSVCRIALAVMQLHGVADVAAVMQNNSHAATKNWLAVPRLMNRLALQRSMRLSAAEVYEQHAGYMSTYSAERLAGRLRFLEGAGLLEQQLLVPDKKQALQAWEREHSQSGKAQPAYISVREVCVLPDAQFASLPAVRAAGGLPALRGFEAGLKSSPGWLELQAAAEAKRAQLMPQLPASLRRAAEEGGQRGWRWRRASDLEQQ